MEAKAGRYKAKGIKESVQYGETKNEILQIALDMDIKEAGRLTTFLYFSQVSAPYSFERLRLLGWKGNDITDLTGIDTNEVDVDVKTEMYEGRPQIKCDIVTAGGGRITIAKTLDPKAFAARLAAIMPKTVAVPDGAPAPPF